MRAPWILGLALIASCGKQLNPDYCAHNPSDPDCQGAGLVLLDAAPRCTTDADCAAESKVCDTTSGACVQCTAANTNACTGSQKVCSADDTCVECTTGAECPSMVCLPDNTCAGSGTIHYASPNGSGAAPCTNPNVRCTLANAIQAATAEQNVVQLGGGTYSEGTIALGVPGLQLITDANAQVVITGSSDGQPLFTVTANASLAQMTLDRSGGDGIQCDGAALTLDQVVISNSNNNAVNEKDCTLTVRRSKLIDSNQAAIATSGTSTLLIRNNFMYGGGNSFYTNGGALSLGGSPSGEIRFNTIGFNKALSFPGNHAPAGFACANSLPGDFNFSDNLFASDSPEETDDSCGRAASSANWLGDANDVKFVSTSSSTYDLHLTAQTPDTTQDGIQAVRDNANTNCTNVPNDYDNDVRPYNGACDFGADEFTPSTPSSAP